MKTKKKLISRPRSIRSALKEFKDTFNSWCGLLSVDEIMANTELVRVIDRLERMLVAAGG